MKRIMKAALLPSLCVYGLVGCGSHVTNSASQENDKQLTLMSFEEKTLPQALSFSGVEGALTQKAGVTNGKQALSLSYLARDNYKASFAIKPDTPWDLSSFKNASIAFDITNTDNRSIHLFVKTFDADGKVQTRSVHVPSNATQRYYVEVEGYDLEVDTGIRSNPNPRPDLGLPVIWRYGNKDIDTSKIEKITFGIQGIMHDRNIVMDNFTVHAGEDYDASYLKNLADQYGQRTTFEYEGKVHSDAEMKAQYDAEQSILDGKLMADRSRWGGWKSGPKQAGTGYFTTRKINGKWSLVDPDGHLFFSTGIANIRMSNTTTMTGIDFDKDVIAQRTSDDVTPEDSKGVIRVHDDALKTAFVSSPIRRDMFTWLPGYDHELADHYGYRRSVHTGPVKHGESFSFYRANLERKYGSTGYMDAWRKTTVDRMINWGFTSFGNWVSPDFYQNNRYPYFANGWIIGDFKTISSGNDYWSPLPDPFDPVFAERAAATVSVIANEVKNNPWCIGVFIDNEKSWGEMGSVTGQYGIVINAMAMDAKESPTKSEFMRLLKQKYGSVAALNAQWNTQYTSWNILADGVELKEHNAAQQADYAVLLEAYGSEYFRIVRSELKKVMPNHMYMGARFADWGMTPEIVRSAAKYADVVSYNFYKESMHPAAWKFLPEIDMPSIIGEFHMGATDHGLLNPGLVHAQDQAERGKMFTEYMHGVIDNPYFVGAHWFQYIDSPLTGRAYDGENYNVGFVSVTDTPYREMVEAAQFVNRNLYLRRFGDVEK